ncbi:UbiA prenyltransferase family protein [Amycolatopsis sulphurea]|uniref:hypothetical protein n=1 Tax=Amycolatopsis sulphurea TaxID=76022 RepID=UPI001145C0EA|nr:hypothetical protein [Amycolatopsis sulphurea]
MLQLLRCLIMNLPDIPGDRRVGKITPAGVLGPARVALVYAGGHAIVYAALLVGVVTGVLPVVPSVALLATFPIPLWVALRLLRGDIDEHRTAESVTFWSSMALPTSSCAVLIGTTIPALAQGHVPSSWLVVATATFALFGLHQTWYGTLCTLNPSTDKECRSSSTRHSPCGRHSPRINRRRTHTRASAAISPAPSHRPGHCPAPRTGAFPTLVAGVAGQLVSRTEPSTVCSRSP